MRGIDMKNFPCFDAEALRLRRAGFDVVSPAELDRVNGIHEFTDPLPEGFLEAAMERNLKAICGCDGMALLPGWATSEGVRPELELARCLGQPICMVEEWLMHKAEGDEE